MGSRNASVQASDGRKPQSGPVWTTNWAKWTCSISSGHLLKVWKGGWSPGAWNLHPERLEEMVQFDCLTGQSGNSFSNCVNVWKETERWATLEVKLRNKLEKWFMEGHWAWIDLPDVYVIAQIYEQFKTCCRESQLLSEVPVCLNLALKLG